MRVHVNVTTEAGEVLERMAISSEYTPDTERAEQIRLARRVVQLLEFDGFEVEDLN